MDLGLPEPLQESMVTPTAFQGFESVSVVRCLNCEGIIYAQSQVNDSNKLPNLGLHDQCWLDK